MQHARFKPHAEERTRNPVQRPNFRGRAKLELECPNPGSPRGQAGARGAGDVEVTRAEGGTTPA